MKPPTTERIEQIIERPMFHPFPSTSACIRWLAQEVLRLRKDNDRLSGYVAKHALDKEGPK